MSNLTRIVCICGESVPITETEQIWLQTGQGMTSAYVHPGCVERKIEQMAKEWGGARRISEPKSAGERAEEEAKAERQAAEYRDLAEHMLSAD